MSSSPQQLEIEIKSLLGDQEKASRLQQNLLQRFPQAQVVEESKQLNHYFVGENWTVLQTKLKPYLPTSALEQFQAILDHGKNISVRTRQLNNQVIFVMKAAIDDTTSSNGIARQEFETPVKDLTIDELDKILLSAGFKYQAKWSRERKAYQMSNITICIDKNAGYGYLAEFEALVTDPVKTEQVKKELRQLMSDLGAAELAQDRLERMFAHYNAHWPEYYGTDKVFTIE